MRAEELVGKLVLRAEPVRLSEHMVDTEFMSTPHIIEKYNNGGITLVNPKTGYKQFCNHEWDDTNWVEAKPEILLKNFHRQFNAVTVQDVVDKLGLDDPDRVPGNTTQERTKSIAPIESKGADKDPVLVIRNADVTTVIQELSKATNKRGDGDVIIIDLIDTDGRFRLGIGCIGDMKTYRYYKMIEVDNDLDPDIIIIDCHEFYMKMARLLQYGVREVISMLQIGVLMASTNYGLETLKYIDRKEAIVCSGALMYKATIYPDHAELNRKVSKDDIDCPVVVLSQDEASDLNKYMETYDVRALKFDDL